MCFKSENLGHISRDYRENNNRDTNNDRNFNSQRCKKPGHSLAQCKVKLLENAQYTLNENALSA